MWKIKINLEKEYFVSSEDLDNLDRKFFDDSKALDIIKLKDYYVECFLEELKLDKENETVKKYIRYTAAAN